MRPWILLSALLLLTNQPASAIDEPATGDHAMVVTAEPLATQAAVRVLVEGGSAADAAITAALVLAVTEPYSSGVGGGGFFVGWDQGDQSAYALDCRETAPSAASRDMFLGADGVADPALSRTGALSVATPGLIRGLWDLHQREGRLAWGRLLRPAIDLAADGFPVQEMLAQRLAYHHGKGRFDSAMQAVFMPSGQVPPVGSLLRQEDLARTLAAVAGQGPDAFYAGPVAEAMAGSVQRSGGILTTADLAAYRSVWRDPIRGSYRGHEIIGMPPPSSGGVHLVQMLNILEGFDLAGKGYGSADAWHLMFEAMKFAYADRSRFMGDPDHTPIPVARLTSREHAAQQRSRIAVDHALAPTSIEGAPRGPESDHTTHLSVVDAQGNAVAATLTINLSFGSGMIAEGTGVILNDEMDDFAAAPGTPNAFGLIQSDANAVAPHRRPLSSMTPTIVLRDGAVAMVTGSPGGAKIITSTLQTIVHVLDFGMDVRQAVAAPRIHHQWYPETGYYEEFGMSPDTRRALEDLGHRLTARSPMGNVQVILRDHEQGRWTGASDPRGMGLAQGY